MKYKTKNQGKNALIFLTTDLQNPFQINSNKNGLNRINSGLNRVGNYFFRGFP